MDGRERPPSHGGLTAPDPARSPQEPLAGSPGTQTPTRRPPGLQTAQERLQERIQRLTETYGAIAPPTDTVDTTPVQQTMEEAVAVARSILPVAEVYAGDL